MGEVEFPMPFQLDLISSCSSEPETRGGVYRLSDEERAAVHAGMEEARRGDFASEEEIEAFYQLHRRLASLRGA
jgi:hypothetical protein